MSKTRNLSRILGAGGTLDVQTTATFATTANLPTSGNTAGDQAYVSGNNRLYMWNGSGWYNIALINTTPTFDTGGQPNSSYVLDAEVPQESITITMGASDPEDIPLTYSYVTGGSMDSMATISQDSSVFTITPKTFAQMDSQGGPHTGTITFRATDGINILPAISSFTLTFITTIEHSSSTALLLKVEGTGNNSTPVDASTSSHALAMSGATATMGTFSPYRHGGYSHYFDDSSNALRDDTIADAMDTNAGHVDNFTLEMWIYTTVPTSNEDYIVSSNAVSNGANDFLIGISKASWSGSVIGTNFGLSGSKHTHQNTWHHMVVVHDHDATGPNNDSITLYIDGRKVFKETGLPRISFANNTFAFGTEADSADFGNLGNYYNGYIHDVKITKAALYDSNEEFIPVPVKPTTPHETANIFHGFQTGTIDKRFSGPNGTGTIYDEVACIAFTPYDNDAYKNANGSSANFPGTSDEIVTTDASTNPVILGAGDFTIEFWIHKNAHDSGWQAILSQQYHETGGWRIYKNSSSDDFIWYSNSSTILQSSGVGIMRAGEWRHIALVRSSGTLTWYGNGKNYGSTSNTTNYTGNNGEIEIGKGTHYSTYPTNSAYADLRIVSGTAVYTGEFTPPSAPLTPTGGTYPSTTNVNVTIPVGHTKLLLNMNNAKIFDKSQNQNINLTGAVASSAQQHFSENTILFDGTDDIIDMTNPISGTENHTHEAWVYPTGGDATYKGFFASANPSSGDGISVSKDKAIGPQGGSADLILFNPVVPDNEWSHVVLQRSEGVHSLYRNGVLQGTSTTAINFSNANLRLASRYADNTNRMFGGHIHDFRVSKGLARYPYIATPKTLTQTNSGMEKPDAEFPTVSSANNTLFLGCHASTIVDGGYDTVSVTASGNSAVSSFHPRGGSAGMKSVSFDGTGDYLSATTASALNADDWTIEYWVWHNNLSANQIHLAFGAYTPAFYYRYGSAKFAMYQSSAGFGTNYWETFEPKENTWYHLAWVHDDAQSKIALFVDGAFWGDVTYTGSISSTSLRVGDDTTGAYMNGYISNLRIVKEKLYTKNFTSPTTAFSA